MIKSAQILSDVSEPGPGAAMMLGMQQGILSAQQSVINTATSGANAVLAAVKGVYDYTLPFKGI